MCTCFTRHAALSASVCQRWTCGTGGRAYNLEYFDGSGNWRHACCRPCRIRELEDEISDLRCRFKQSEEEISDLREKITSCERSLREAEFHVAEGRWNTPSKHVPRA